MCRDEDEYARDENRRRITELCLKASARCCVPTSPILLLPSLSVVSVYVYKKKMRIREIKMGRESPSYFLKHQPSVVPQDVRFYW